MWAGFQGWRLCQSGGRTLPSLPAVQLVRAVPRAMSHEPHEPNLIPKVRFYLAEFLPSRYLMTPETAHLGHPMRIPVRLQFDPGKGPRRNANTSSGDAHALPSFQGSSNANRLRQGAEALPNRYRLRAAKAFRRHHPERGNEICYAGERTLLGALFKVNGSGCLCVAA